MSCRASTWLSLRDSDLTGRGSEARLRGRLLLFKEGGGLGGDGDDLFQLTGRSGRGLGM